MSRFIPKIDEKSFKDKVVVITGGSNGIGAATVEKLCNLGAKVVFGDIQVEAGKKQAQRLSAFPVKFIKTDVTIYEDVLALFDTALEAYGKIDCAISNAGVAEVGNWVDPELDLEGIKKMPSTRTLDVNLLGSLYFTRIAAVYLRRNCFSDNDDKSIILLSSVAGFKESPGMPVYQASKHGIYGLLRSLRLTLPAQAHIRINAIAPWFTATTMTSKLVPTWAQHNLPMNQPAGVAEIIAGVMAATTSVERGGEGMNGKMIYVEGDRGWEVEAALEKCAETWMGEGNSAEFERGNKLMGMGDCWQF